MVVSQTGVCVFFFLWQTFEVLFELSALGVGLRVAVCSSQPAGFPWKTGEGNHLKPVTVKAEQALLPPARGMEPFESNSLSSASRNFQALSGETVQPHIACAHGNLIFTVCSDTPHKMQGDCRCWGQTLQHKLAVPCI